VAKEGRGENEVVQPVNPAANAAVQPMLRQMLQPTPLATSPTTQLTLLTSKETLPQTQDTMRELNLL
jgi:hypothetical protein